MPIRPDQRPRYPGDWPAISLRIREAGGHRCRTCGVKDRAWGWRDERGDFHEVDQDEMRDLLGADVAPPFYARLGRHDEMVRVIEIVITVAHLDHQPENNADENLAPLCQRDHLNHDRDHHRAVAAQRRHLAMATRELPLGEGARA